MFVTYVDTLIGSPSLQYTGIVCRKTYRIAASCVDSRASTPSRTCQITPASRHAQTNNHISFRLFSTTTYGVDECSTQPWNGVATVQRHGAEGAPSRPSATAKGWAPPQRHSFDHPSLKGALCEIYVHDRHDPIMCALMMLLISMT
jgi:hypothetical protein